MSKPSLVLFPSYGMGHLIPMVELAKHFIKHHFSIAIVVIDPPDPSPVTSSFISGVTSAHPSISFHRIQFTNAKPPPHPIVATFNGRDLAAIITSLSETSSVRALVVDMFCTSAMDVAKELNLPAYVFFASGAFVLDAFLLLPKIQSQTEASFKDMGDEMLEFPGLPPMPASHMPVNLQDRKNELYSAYICHFERLPKADAVMINTFESLERRAVEALRDGSCFPGRPAPPPIYCIGPLVGAAANKDGQGHECLRWLDAQPRGSVVLLSFGSVGAFSKEQLREMAIGLERSGQRFLWVVRSPPIVDGSLYLGLRAEPELVELLPEGFLERTKERGMVVKSWAPQAVVLRHEAVGGFVSHCGWNSVLEAVSSGVPMIAWPLYAEQRMNKVFLVEEAKLAVEMKGYDKELVSAAEVETKVRWLLESDGGKELKGRAEAMKESAAAAWRSGGATEVAWMELVRMLKGGTH